MIYNSCKEAEDYVSNNDMTNLQGCSCKIIVHGGKIVNRKINNNENNILEGSKCIVAKNGEEFGTECINNFINEAIIDGILDPILQPNNKNKHILIWNQETETYPFKIYIDRLETMEEVESFFNNHTISIDEDY